jgi:hypothetical protein
MPEPWDHLVAGMQETLAAEQAELDKLDEQRKERLARVTKLRKAVDALTSSPSEVKRGPGRPRKDGTTPAQRQTPRWTPRPGTLETVERALIEHGTNGMTVKDLAAIVNMADETVRRSLDALREQDRARLAGTVKRGAMSAKAYKPMPNGQHDETELDLNTTNGAATHA